MCDIHPKQTSKYKALPLVKFRYSAKYTESEGMYKEGEVFNVMELYINCSVCASMDLINKTSVVANTLIRYMNTQNNCSVEHYLTAVKLNDDSSILLGEPYSIQTHTFDSKYNLVSKIADHSNQLRARIHLYINHLPERYYTANAPVGKLYRSIKPRLLEMMISQVTQSVIRISEDDVVLYCNVCDPEKTIDHFKQLDTAMILKSHRKEKYLEKVGIIAPKNPNSIKNTKIAEIIKKEVEAQMVIERAKYQRLEQGRYRSRTPERYRSRTPERYRSRTPERYRSRTPERYRSRTPERYRSRTPERRHKRSRTPEKQHKRSQSPNPRHKKPRTAKMHQEKIQHFEKESIHSPITESNLILEKRLERFSSLAKAAVSPDSILSTSSSPATGIEPGEIVDIRPMLLGDMLTDTQYMFEEEDVIDLNEE